MLAKPDTEIEVYIARRYLDIVSHATKEFLIDHETSAAIGMEHKGKVAMASKT